MAGPGTAEGQCIEGDSPLPVTIMPVVHQPADTPRMFSSISQAARASGRSTAAVLFEALRLRFGPGQLGLAEYLDFRLHDQDLAPAQKQQFGGWRAQRMLEEILIDDCSRFLSLDKITMYALMQSYGLPIPALRAVYGTHRPGAVPALQTPQALADFLSDARNLPVYVKPSYGAYGRGNTLAVQRQGQDLVLGNGDRVPLQEFCASLQTRSGLGWVLQEPLTPARAIAEHCGDKISGVRLHTFMTPSGPKPVKAIWKMNAGTRDSDNFHHGQSGNLLAAVDLETGRVTRVVSGVGLGQQVDPPHPATGHQLKGFQIPHWHQILRVTLDAHWAFPGFICPGWDVAVCEDGPRLLEVNGFGDIDLSQHAFRQGFIDTAFVALMRERRLDGLLRGSAQAGKRSPENHRLGVRKWHWRW